MFAVKKKKSISDEIEHVLESLAKMTVGTDDYAKAAAQLEVLCKAKGSDANSRVSPDTWVLVAANLLGIVLILNYEKMGVVSSKAVSLLLRGRV